MPAGRPACLCVPAVTTCLHWLWPSHLVWGQPGAWLKRPPASEPATSLPSPAGAEDRVGWAWVCSVGEPSTEPGGAGPHALEAYGMSDFVSKALRLEMRKTAAAAGGEAAAALEEEELAAGGAALATFAPPDAVSEAPACLPLVGVRPRPLLSCACSSLALAPLPRPLLGCAGRCCADSRLQSMPSSYLGLARPPCAPLAQSPRRARRLSPTVSRRCRLCPTTACCARRQRR
jgi:hypothetical protein